MGMAFELNRIVLLWSKYQSQGYVICLSSSFAAQNFFALQYNCWECTSFDYPYSAANAYVDS
jgi:hypothetical protein